MIQPELSTTELYNMVASLYQNYTWNYWIYVDYDNTKGYSITLEFTSPPNSEDQVWTGRFSWNYDDNGIAERFDFTVWRMTTALLSDYNPVEDESKLIAFYDFVFETPRSYNVGFIVIIFFFGGIASLMISPFVFFGFIILSVGKFCQGNIGFIN